jgi:hypothetical protein
MSDLDKVLLELSKSKEKDPSRMDRIKIAGDVRIKKVAFDMYKVFGDQYGDLWSIESSGDESFLVRSSRPEFGRRDDGLWSTASSYDADTVTLSYKGVPLCSFSSDEYGFSGDDIFAFKSALLDMASGDPSFVKKVVASQNKAKASAIGSLFPDLLKTN